MSTFNIDKLKNNLRTLSKEYAVRLGNNTEEYKKATWNAIENHMKEMSFTDIKAIYEKGIENNPFFADDVWASMIGYLLITRYNISHSEYLVWSKKQSATYAYALLKLIDINDEFYKEKSKEEKNRQDIRNFNELKTQLSKKKRLIDFCDTESTITLFGKNICIQPKAEKIVNLYSGCEDVSKYALDFFWNNFNSRCSEHTEANENLKSIFEDVNHAIWFQYKKNLSQLNVNDNVTKKIENEFYANQNFVEVVEELNTVYVCLQKQVKEWIQSLRDMDANRRNTTFYGGGSGISGSLQGMFAATIMEGAKNLYADVRTKGDVVTFQREVKKFANEIYFGDETKKYYEYKIKECCKKLTEISVDVICPNEIESQDEVKRLLEDLDSNVLKQIDGDSMREFCSYLLFVYPLQSETYNFVISQLLGITYELSMIANRFNVKFDLRKELKRGVLKKKIVRMKNIYLLHMKK